MSHRDWADILAGELMDIITMDDWKRDPKVLETRLALELRKALMHGLNEQSLETRQEVGPDGHEHTYLYSASVKDASHGHTDANWLSRYGRRTWQPPKKSN